MTADRDPLAEARRLVPALRRSNTGLWVGWFAELLALIFVAGLVAGALYGAGSP